MEKFWYQSLWRRIKDTISAIFSSRYLYAECPSKSKEKHEEPKEEPPKVIIPQQPKVVYPQVVACIFSVSSEAQGPFKIIVGVTLTETSVFWQPTQVVFEVTPSSFKPGIPTVSLPKKCCEFKSITIKNIWDKRKSVKVKVSSKSFSQEETIPPYTSFTFKGNIGKAVHITVVHSDPRYQNVLIEDVRIYCKDLLEKKYKKFISIEITNFTWKDCKPEEETTKLEKTGERTPEEKPPTTEKITPEETISPEKPQEESIKEKGKTIEKFGPPKEKPKKKGESFKERLSKFCLCQYRDIKWLPWKGIEASYKYVPSPDKKLILPLGGKIELKALGKDEDILLIEGSRLTERGSDCVSKKSLHIADEVYCMWHITAGPGFFDEGEKIKDGEAVFYYIPSDLPIGRHHVIIRTIVDDTGSRGDDAPNEGRIELRIERKEENPEFCYVDARIKDFREVSVPSEPKTGECPCKVNIEWKEGEEFTHSMFRPTGKTVICANCSSIWVAGAGDGDDLEIKVKDENAICKSDREDFKNIRDVYTHYWFAEAGKYLGTNIGSKVIYRAPEKLPSEDVYNEKITLKTRDSFLQYKDRPPKDEEVRITIISADIDINTDPKPCNRWGIPTVSNVSDIDEEDERREISLGGYIWVNDDNDHKVSNDKVIDKNDKNYEGDNDLEPMIINISRNVWDRRLGLEVELELIPVKGNLTGLKVWKDKNKKEILLDDVKPKIIVKKFEELDSDADGVFFVEGIESGIYKIILRVKRGNKLICKDVIKITVFSVASAEWVSNGDTVILDRAPIEPPPGQVREGKVIFPDKLSPDDDRIHDMPKIRVKITPQIPPHSGWILPLYAKVFDVDHYHNDTDFDPNGAYEPLDNKTPYTSVTYSPPTVIERGDEFNIGIKVEDRSVDKVIRQDSRNVEWAQKIDKTQNSKEAILKITYPVPCNNWRVALGMGDTLRDAIRIDEDEGINKGCSLEYIDDTPLNIKVLKGEGNTSTQSTHTLTVWRKLYVEEDCMEKVDFNEGPLACRSIRRGRVLLTEEVPHSPGHRAITVNISIDFVNQFRNGYAFFFHRTHTSSGTEEMYFLGRLKIIRSTAGLLVNKIIVEGEVPADSNYVIICDDDVDADALMYNVKKPFIQPDFTPLTRRFNLPQNFPAACIYVDFHTLDSFDNKISFDLNVENSHDAMEVMKRGKQVIGGKLFWVITLLNAYQFSVSESWDPHSGPGIHRVVMGIAIPYWWPDSVEGATGGAIIFVEGCRDFALHPKGGREKNRVEILERTTLHEAAHLLGALHSDGGVMGKDRDSPEGNVFSAKTLRRIMLTPEEGPGRRL